MPCKGVRSQADKAALAVSAKKIAQQHAIELCTGFAADFTAQGSSVQCSKDGGSNP